MKYRRETHPAPKSQACHNLNLGLGSLRKEAQRFFHSDIHCMAIPCSPSSFRSSRSCFARGLMSYVSPMPKYPCKHPPEQKMACPPKSLTPCSLSCTLDPLFPFLNP